MCSSTSSNLNGAHDALVDVKAQSEIITSTRFIPYIDKTKSIRFVEEIFSQAKTRDMLKSMESIRPVHEPWSWFELQPDDDVTYTAPRTDRYTGPDGGANGFMPRRGLDHDVSQHLHHRYIEVCGL